MEMNNTKTYYHLLLDRSGSMTSCIEETVDGVNQQIQRIKEVAERYPEQELVTSLTLFNHTISKPWIRVRSNSLRELTFSDYSPIGRTALYDAIGFVIQELQRTVGDEVDNDEATVVVVIVTDGYENASGAFSHDQIAASIAELELTRKWTFSYIGSTLDAVEIAKSMNIKGDNAMRFNPSETSEIFKIVDFSLESYYLNKRLGKTNSGFFVDKEKDL